MVGSEVKANGMAVNATLYKQNEYIFSCMNTSNYEQDALQNYYL